jgi:hypothetical protein
MQSTGLPPRCAFRQPVTFGLDAPTVEYAVLVCLEHAVALDDNVRQLASLPLGWHAWHRSAPEPWVIEPNSYDGEEDA